MKTLSLIKEIYWNGFKVPGNLLIRTVLMVYAWLCFSLLGLALVVFILNLAQGKIS
jgi:hypothetical protein